MLRLGHVHTGDAAHVIAALNARFDVSISTRHVFTAEKDPARQAFIRAAHGDHVEFLCHDVSEISDGRVTNILQAGAAPVRPPQADVLVSGPSCVNMSQQRADSASFVAAYEDGDTGCESGLTYVSGFRDAVRELDVVAAVYENVTTVLRTRKDTDGKAHPPAVLQIESDMRAAHFNGAVRQLDSRYFLVPQRRTRAWGLATKGDTGKDSDVYAETFQDLHSSTHFRHVWDASKSHPAKLNSSQRKKLDALLTRYSRERADWEDIYMDLNVSSGRESGICDVSAAWGSRIQPPAETQPHWQGTFGFAGCFC